MSDENNIKKPDNEDMLELVDSFLNYMDDVITEAEHEKNEHAKLESPVKQILEDLSGTYDADKLITQELDEEALAEKFEKGELESEQTATAIEEIESYEELSENREKRVFYAALYLSGKPVEIKTFKKMLKPLNLENRLITYAEEFNNMRIGIKIRAVSGGYQIVTDSDVSMFLEKYFGERTESLSKAALETAAIIAYRQPVTKAEVEEMREVNSSGTMRYLLDKNLIKVIGRKQVPGKPLLYATTKYFLEYFGLNDISELPTFREWQELKQNQ